MYFFPNTYSVLNDSILKKNNFEWFKTGITLGHKHIFLKEISKQRYLTGLKFEIDNPQN